jgi:hypothetical protein
VNEKTSEQERQHERGAELIRAAFDRARESGAPEWRTMTTAVLKNRILDLTDRGFAESDWGAPSFGGFLKLFPDVVTLDLAGRPPRATLVSEEAPAAAPTEAEPGQREIGPRRRIRGDLWSAVLDYSSPGEYWWDGSRAVRVKPGSSLEGAEARRLPTATQEEFKAWRAEFVKRKSEESPGAGAFLHSWLDREEPLTALPGTFRIPWVVELKRRVLDRLEDWFTVNEIAPPPDLLIDESAPPPGSSGSGDPSSLRDYVLAVVGQMTREELEALNLPVSALLRVKR